MKLTSLAAAAFHDHAWAVWTHDYVQGKRRGSLKRKWTFQSAYTSQTEAYAEAQRLAYGHEVRVTHEGYGEAPRTDPARRPSRTSSRARGRELSVPERHQLKIARQTLNMPDAMVGVMGGPNKAESREIIRRLTGQEPREDPRRARRAPRRRR